MRERVPCGVRESEERDSLKFSIRNRTIFLTSSKLKKLKLKSGELERGKERERERGQFMLLKVKLTISGAGEGEREPCHFCDK